MIDPRQFWYVACPSESLQPDRPAAVTLFDHWIVCFRDSSGNPVALLDRCLHRCGRLSRGSVHHGLLRCPYHGWKYDAAGRVVEIPSAGESLLTTVHNLSASRYDTREQDGYIYIRLTQPPAPNDPFPMPHYQETGWQNIRLVHDFASTITHCVENFIDIPHTAYVHHGIFRKESRQKLVAEIRRSNGEVHVSYKNENRNIGSFGWFLNPRGEPVQHTDSFYMPNITHVAYRIGSRVEYLITSQSVPITEESTRVFTDITFRFGIWSRIARPFARRQAQRVIRQDIDELNAQMEVIRKCPAPFVDTPADFIHKMISQIREAIARGDDPRQLPEISRTVTFWV